MPVRKIPASRASNTRGLLASGKAIGSAMYESSLERDYLLLLDYDRRVKQFEAQPLELDVDDVEGRRRYIPKVLVEFLPGHGRPWLVDIKCEKDLREKWAILRPRFKAAFRHCGDRGWIFHIMTERHIRTPLLQNVKFLRDYRCLQPDPVQSTALIAAASCPRSVPNLVVASGLDPAAALPLIWHHLWHGHLSADLGSAPIDMETEISRHAAA